MNIKTEKENNTLIINIDERLDTFTAPELEAEIKAQSENCDKIVLDVSNLEYISSAGLRTLVFAHKIMSEKSGFVIKSPNESVMDILNITNLSSVLNIEQ